MGGKLSVELVLDTAKAAAQYKEFFETVNKSAPKVSFKDFMAAGASPDDVKKSGENLGGHFSRGFYQAASKFGGGKDLSKVMGLPDITSLDKKIDKADWKKVLIGLGLGFTNPYIGSRLLSDELGKGNGSGTGFTAGLFGKGGIAGFSEIFIAFKAFKFSVDSFKSAVTALVPVFDNAHKLYGKALSSGLSLGFVAKRQIAADILGVSENDVMRFKQGQMVMNQISDAVGKIARTAPDLAYTWAQYKILGTNIMADAALLADHLTPALNGFAIAMGRLIKFLETPIGNKSLMAAIAGTFPVASLQFKSLQKLFEHIGNSDLAGKTDSSFGQPQSFIKQLPAGAFEKMGLVIGGGVADKSIEYQRRMAGTLEKIYQQGQAAVKKAGGYYMNRNPYVSGH